MYLFFKDDEKLQKSVHLPQFGGKEKCDTQSQSSMTKLLNANNSTCTLDKHY